MTRLQYMFLVMSSLRREFSSGPRDHDPWIFLVLAMGPLDEYLTFGSTLRGACASQGVTVVPFSPRRHSVPYHGFSALTRHPVHQIGPWSHNEFCIGRAGLSQALVSVGMYAWALRLGPHPQSSSTLSHWASRLPKN